MNKITLDEVTHIKPVTDEKRESNVYEGRLNKIKKKKKKIREEERKEKGRHIIDIYV